MRRTLIVSSIVLVQLLLSTGACSRDPERAKQEYLRSGNRYFDEKKYGEAAIQYRNALKQDPQFGEARYKLAQSNAQRGDLAEAYRDYLRAADLLPDNSEVQISAATFLLLTGQFEDAKTRARQELTKNPNNVKAQIVLGNALARLKDFDNAVIELEEAVKLEPDATAYSSVGDVQFARERQPEAEQAFRSAIASDPRSVSAHLALANYLWRIGRIDEAERSLLTAAEIDPNNLLANRGLGAFYLSTNRSSRAEQYLRTAADRDGTRGAIHKLLLADYYLSSSRHDDALKVLESIAMTNENFGTSRTRVAAIQYSKQQTDAAYKTIDEVLLKEPQNPMALLTKARFLRAESKYDKALELATAAAMADPRNIQAHYDVGVLHVDRNERSAAIAAFNQVVKLNPRAVAALVQLSRLTLERGETDTALRLAQNASTVAKTEPNVQLAFARSLIAKGWIEDATPIVKQLVTNYPNAAVVHSTAGVLGAAKKDWATARRAFERALQLQPDSLEALTGLVGADFAENKPAVARERVDRQLARTPDRADLLVLSARVYEKTKDVPKAEEALQKATRADPNNLSAYSMLGAILVAERKLDLAREQFDQVARKDPTSVAAQTMVAIILEMQNRRPEARQRYERILQTNSRAAVAANNLAWIYAESGDNLTVALQLAKAAHNELPEQPAVSDTLGWVYYKKGMPTLAIPPFEQAANKEPQNPIFRFHLGLAYAKAGNTLKAKAALEQALKLDGQFDGADEARKTLASL
jgi:putative PEP-CTERM system TPR-repeat lipoprotein